MTKDGPFYPAHTPTSEVAAAEIVDIRVASIRTGEWCLYGEGDLLYDDMLSDIDNAKHSIRLESYILSSDAVGGRFVASLCGAARRGVAVSVRADRAGSWLTLARADLSRLDKAGANFRWSRPWAWRKPFNVNRRNHRKLVVIDEVIGYVGGFNIHAAGSLRAYGISRWRDTHIRFGGVLAGLAARLFDTCGEESSVDRVRTARANGTSLIPSRSRRCRHELRCALHDAIKSARTRIWVSTPYFVPDSRTHFALCRAARRGIDVRVIVPLKSDWPIVQWAARASYTLLLASGARIFEYEPRMLHAKTMLTDRRWASVGTANFDYRSLFANDEINLVDHGGKLNEALAAHFELDLGQSREILAKFWKERPWHAPFAEAVGWAIRRWL